MQKHFLFTSWHKNVKSSKALDNNDAAVQIISKILFIYIFVLRMFLMHTVFSFVRNPAKCYHPCNYLGGHVFPKLIPHPRTVIFQIILTAANSNNLQYVPRNLPSPRLSPWVPPPVIGEIITQWG